MDEDLVERVARAIAPPIMLKFDGWHPDDPVEWERLSDNDRAGLLAIARTAIAAMPSDTIPIIEL